MKRVVSAFLALILVFSCVAVSSAATFADAANHWANAAIEYMVGKSILNGYEDGSFRPDRTVTRAEFIKMLDETFGLTATTSINYTDVSTSDWFYPYVAKAEAQGYLLNYGKALNPSGALTRQEAAALLARYLELDPEKAASPSTFPDYASIKSAYRDYVLQATAAGLFQGYAEDGTFRPDTALTRAQALTILSRAAGSIYKTSTTGLDAGAVAGNAVITQSGVTVTNANIPGRLIISEGASNGTITLSGCTVGELIIRGTANVVLSDTEVTSMNVNSSTSGFTTMISLTSNASVDAAVLDTPADLDLASRTSIDLLTVGKGAKRSSAIGSGSVKEANILSSGFTADKIPSKYDIATGVSAVFAGRTYTGNSAEVPNTGFTSKPVTYASSASCYLTASSSEAGTVFYYYTSSSAAPTKTTFDSFYNAAAVKSSYSLSAGISREMDIGDTALVGTYPYIAVQFRDSSRNTYNPVLISNKASTGFVSTPAVNTSSSTHQLTYSAVESGTLFYYYTRETTALTVSSFQTAYGKVSASYRGEIEAVSGKSVTSSLKSASSVSGYGYVAILLEDEGGSAYQPLLIPVSSNYSIGGGGAETITCTVGEEGTSLAFTPAFSGTLQFYFTTSSTVPTSAQFDTNYAAAAAEGIANSLQITAGSRFSRRIADEDTAYRYPYIALRITSGTTVYAPVILSATGLSVDITNSGFTEIPTVGVSNGYFTLNMKTTMPATVYYYLTDSSSVYSNAVFNTNYTNATNSALASPNGGYVNTNGYSAVNMQTILKASSNSGRRYLALMVAVNNQAYKPIVVQLPYVGETAASASELFVTGPVYNLRTMTWHQIDFTPRYSGRILYYYTDDVESIDAEEMVAQILFATDNDLELSGTRSVTANTLCQIPVNSSNFPDYAVLIFIDDAGMIYEPVILTTDGATSSSNTETGFSGTPTISMTSSTPTLSYAITGTGTVYYYFTNTSYVPSDYATFLNMYNSTSMANYRGSVEVSFGHGSKTLTTKSSVANYVYAILMFQVDTGSTGGYRKPIQIRINASSGSSSTAFSGEPYLNGTTLYFTPVMSGTLYYNFTETNTVSSWMAPITALQQQMQQGDYASSYIAALLGTYTGISDYLTQGRGGSSVVSVGSYVSQRSLYVNVNTSYPYMAVWMVSADGKTMSQPSFVSLSGYSGGTVPGGSSYPTGTAPGGTVPGGTGSTITPTIQTTNGFAINPYYTDLGRDYMTGRSDGTVFLLPEKAGYVEYYYTNDTTTSVSATTFTLNLQAAAEQNTSYVGTTYVSAYTEEYIDVSQPYGLYKYMWIRFSTYTGDRYVPVRVQLS